MNPAILVIFGITGDLARRKLLPGLYNLARFDLLPNPCRIIGVTRQQLDAADLLETIEQSVEQAGEDLDPDVLDRLATQLEIHTMDLLSLDAYARLNDRLGAIEDEAGLCMSRLFYLAIPPQTFTPVVKLLGKSHLNKSCQHGAESRLLIEKPFGYDLSSAHDLINELNQYFDETQIYRIDHYLAKETAQNILTFRFKNPLFRNVWQRQCVKALMITAAETIDIEGRSTFYDQTGALRDFIQSHLLQLLALVTMEEPATLDADTIHHEKLALLKAITPIAADQVALRTVRGQYEDYRTEVRNQHSFTETFAAIQLEINNDRWRHVPVLIRTGKALTDKVVEITLLFTDEHDLALDNTLTIRIQPNEGIALQFLAKKPGLTNDVEPVHMEFCYKRSFIDGNTPDAYERVLVDAFRGDKTLFTTSEEVLVSWRIIQDVITEWAKNGQDLHSYAKGSWGPVAADTLAHQAVGLSWPDQALHICSL